MSNRVERFKEFQKETLETFIAKDKDYGSSVTQTFKKYGITSFLVRMEDKINRVKSINDSGKTQVKNESVIDSLLDLSNYAILCAMELQDINGSNNVEKLSIKEHSLNHSGDGDMKEQDYLKNYITEHHNAMNKGTELHQDLEQETYQDTITQLIELIQDEVEYDELMNALHKAFVDSGYGKTEIINEQLVLLLDLIIKIMYNKNGDE